jgi:hypothetical protein
MSLTPASLKTRLLALLDGAIGEYDFGSGYTEPAVAIGDRPEGVTVSGVELIIPYFPDVPESQRVCGSVYRREFWTLSLLLHGGSALQECADRLSRYFVSGTGVYIPTDSRYGNLPRYRFTFTHRDLYEGLH